MSFWGHRIFLFFAAILLFGAKLPDLDGSRAKEKIEEILSSHVVHKKVDEEIFKRALYNFLEELDPQKNYLTQEEIAFWVEPPDGSLAECVANYKRADFSVFEAMHECLEKAIVRKVEWEKGYEASQWPVCLQQRDPKEKGWAKNLDALRERWVQEKRDQEKALEKLQPAMRGLAMERVKKRERKWHREVLHEEAREKEKWRFARIVKAFAGALDSHTSYFTPGEALQFLISVQQRLYGIGAQLRDDVHGFTVVKMVEGGPAARGGELRLRDKIIAVNGEPVLGMDISDAIDMIRGEENTPVQLTVVRCDEREGVCTEELLEIAVPRGEVVLNESRYEASTIPCGEGVVAYLRLHSFYQDKESSSASDLTKALQQIRKEHHVKGVLLDLRYNSGGMLTQAVAVAGMFIKKGIVVSIKDDAGQVQHLRDLDSRMVWDGPLVIVVNRASASASEIVAQTLQDYGRAIVVGDPATYGKGSFQTFSLHAARENQVNPEGEFKVTRGRYYTVSGRTPQLEGVKSDVVVPGILAEMEVGEKYGKYPLESDQLKENFDDDLCDVPYLQRDRVRLLYKFDLQPKLDTYTQHIETLRKNSQRRLAMSLNYQRFLDEIRAKGSREREKEESYRYGHNDLQLGESVDILKDLILLYP